MTSVKPHLKQKLLGLELNQTFFNLAECDKSNAGEIALPGFPSHTKAGQSYSAIILTVRFQADHTLDHKGLWFQADHTLDIYGPVYDQPGTIKKQSLWFQPDHILGNIWFSL